MKILKNIAFGLITLASFSLTSCDINDLPVFDDSDAFVAFRSSTASVAETDGELSIPVLLSSLNGVEGTVDFEITAVESAPAVEGQHYSVENSSNTLTFTKEENTQYINLKIIDNDSYDGDVRLTITLTNASGVNLGAMNTITVTITDDEHPLAFMLGTYTASCESYFNGATEWSMTFAKDDDDATMVWITNFVDGGSSSSTPIYGTVNDEKTEIHIPVGQTIAVSSSYPQILLEAFLGEEGEEDVDDYIVGYISTNDNGKTVITIPDYWFGSHVYSDDAATTSAGWYNIFMSGAVITMD